jgi:hypothetical protein
MSWIFARLFGHPDVSCQPAHLHHPAAWVAIIAWPRGPRSWPLC